MTTPRKKQLLWIALVFLAVVCADQASKAAIIARFPYPELGISSAKGPTFFRLTHQRNPGGVGGLFRDNRIMRIAAPLLATFILLYLYRHLDPLAKLQSTAYGLIAGGAVGNLIDRLRFGSVTDFLEFNFYFIPFNFPWKHFPAFNLADSAICTGVFFLILTWLRMPPEEPATVQTPKSKKRARKTGPK